MKKFLAIIREDDTFSIKSNTTTIGVYSHNEIELLFTGKILQESLVSDEEFIVNSYQKKGIEFLKDIEGNFALALYDKVHKKVFLARDKVGVNPLFFTHNGGKLIFGTRLSDFQNIEKLQLSINPAVLAQYLQLGYILQPNTIFKECYKVNAGSYLSFDIATNSYTQKEYWKLESCYSEVKTKQSEEEIIQSVEKILYESIAKNTEGTDYGISLSGGYDSSTLVAIAQRQKETPVETFTIGFHEEDINEAPHAKEISKYLGTNHHEHYFTAQDALRLIPKISLVYDEPFSDQASSPTMLTAQLLKEHQINNLIAGDGGDEVFATAENLYSFQRLQAIPYFMKQLITPFKYFPMAKIPYLQNYNNLPQKYNKFIEIILAKSIPKIIDIRNRLFLESDLQQLIREYHTPISTSFDTIDFQGPTECVDEIIGTYFKTTMVDGELVKSYSAMNYENIQLSTPYLNSTLIEYMAKVPSHIKVKNNIKKYILKEIAHNYIPKSLIERPKSGFSIPYGRWMRKELKDILYSQVNKERLDKDKLFYTSNILYIRDQFYAGNDAYKYKLWRIFIFQLWYENFQLKNKG